MNDTERRLFSKRDFILIGALAAVCLALFFIPRLVPHKTLVAVISSDSGETRLDLSSVGSPYEMRISSGGHSLTLSVSGVGVRVTDADCRDGICKNFGLLDRVGDCAVCLPARVVIRIEGSGSSGESEVDAVL